MVRKELDNLKYELYKKSGKSDYITYKQFIELLTENQNVAFTFGELQKKKTKRKGKKDLKIDKKGLYNSSNL